jgi:ADP-L-glycero-D-manno-heptose 6-epimerase
MIIVTGAAGFIGYQVAKRLVSENKHGVCAVDELLFFETRKEHQSLAMEKVSTETILDRSFFEEQKKKGNPVTGIIHMGACTDTTEMRLDYLKEVNLDYTQTLWNLATEFKIPFVYASSAATYGGGEQGYVDDESKMSLLKPLNPYGDSKLQFDLWALEEEKAGRAPPAWSGFKFFNVYGFGERHKGKMASVVLQGFDQIGAKGQLKLFRSHKAGIADGEQKRDFVYVEDVVDILLFALQKPIRRGIYNLGSGQARSFLDLAKATFRALGKEPQIEFIDTPVEIRDRYQYFTEAQMGKLRAEGYTRPMTSLEEGVQKTVEALAKSGL